MMFELTERGYQIILPLLVACSVAAALVRAYRGSLYVLAARARGIVLDWRGISLRDLSVAQATEKVEAVSEDLSWCKLARTVSRTAQRALPVVSRLGRVIGLIQVQKIPGALLDSPWANLHGATGLRRHR